MKSKKIVLFLTIVTTLLSIYYLSFSFVDYRVQRQAEQQAMEEGGKINFDKKQAYLTKIWNEPVYNFFGIPYTYEQVKERSLKLGLDLQGGMHVTMELIPLDLVKGLAAQNTDPAFLEALELAQKQRKKSISTSFGKLFAAAYKSLAPGASLTDIFAKARTGRYSFSTEGEIVKAIDQAIVNAVDHSVAIITSRLNRFGTTQITIQKVPATGRIQIGLPGVTNPARVRKLLQGVAQLRFWTVLEPNVYSSALETLTAPQTIQSMPDPSLLKKLCKATFPYRLAYAPEDIPQVEGILQSRKVKALLPKDLIWMWEQKAQTLSDGVKAVNLYAIQKSRSNQPLLEGTIITHAAQVFDENGKPAVSLKMNQKGASIWKQVTANHIGKRIAIALDNRVYSAPVVNQEIPNGDSQISGHFTLEEAKDLASVLETGSLPAPLSIVEEAIMGPSLGKLAQNQGLMATAIGLGLVMLFMVVYYAKGGLIANVALLFNLLFILGILAQLDATLTLPGIAGLVLTIGMSIDANVLIFERIREELTQQVHIKEAIQRGYAKSYSSIMDANITTFLAGLVLYYLGQGPVRGFAVILIIGIISSIFASIFITRLIFCLLLDNYRKPSLTFAYPCVPMLFKNVTINFIKNRYRFYTFSLSLIAVGGFYLYHYKGLALGVDFSGGSSYTVHFSKPIDASLLKNELSSKFKESVEVRTYGANNVMQITTNYLNSENVAAPDIKVRRRLVAALKNCTALHAGQPASADSDFTITSSTKVGANLAKDVQKSAQKSILFAILGMFFYIALRFRRWQFGLAAVLALVHDALMVIAGFAVARRFGINYEVNEVFIAAMLTVIGYSINDTVVIFDRIREKLTNKALNFTVTVVNDAIRETLSRTVITSFTTLLAVFILFFFGGEALRSFSFALLLGVLFGTYSSICIAAPLLADFGRKIFMIKE